MLSVPGQHMQQHHQQAPPPQMQQPGLMHHPQTPQQSRHISPMNARSTPQPPHHHQVQHAGIPPPHPQAAYYASGPRPSPMASGPVPPSAKRYKPSPANMPHSSIVPPGLGDGMTIDEEEDTSRGDILDHFSPREIAATRYMQHHEWMEEVIGSGYTINQITPVDLSLGLAGELESLTRGLFSPPIYPLPKPGVNDPVSDEKDHKELLREAKSRILAYTRKTEEEMEQMKVAHTKRITTIKSSSIIFKTAEKELRGVPGLEMMLPGALSPQHPVDASDSDSENAVSATTTSREPASPVTAPRSIEEIIREVEAAVGQKIVPVEPFVKYELPADEIIRMGGVVAQDIHQHNIDTEMGDNDDKQMTTLDDDDTAFKLDIPTPLSITDSPGARGPSTGLLEEFHQAAVASPTPNDDPTTSIMEDTIMADFMNVDDIPSKPVTPQQQPVAAGNESATTVDGEDMFTILPLEGAPNSSARPNTQ